MGSRLHRHFLPALAAIGMLAATAGAAVAQDGQRVYARVADATLVLEVTNDSGKLIATGTGFLISEDQVLSNAHVVSGGSVSVSLGPLKVPCRVTRTDQVNDLAVCVMSATSTTVPLTLAANDLAPGEAVFAVGNPRGMAKTISQGLFTGLRELDGRQVAQISAAISPGSSGGPVLNAAGEVVGVAVASLSNAQTLNFAVPLAIVRRFIAGQIVEDTATLITSARRLIQQRNELRYGEPEWKELDLRLVNVIGQIIASADAVPDLDQARELAGFYHADLQVAAARKAVQITHEPTREMLVSLAEALYFSIDDKGPSVGLEEAESAAQRAVESGGERIAEDLNLLANIQNQAGKLHLALENHLKASTVAMPGSAELTATYINLFRVTKDLHRDGEAEGWFKKAIAIGTSNVSGLDWVEYARLLERAERFPEAGDAWLSAFHKNPSRSVYQCEAGESYWIAKRLDAGIAAMRVCLEGASASNTTADLVRAHKALSDMLEQRGVHDQAANHAREAIALAPGDAFAHLYFARALLGQRRFVEAVSSATTAVRLSDGRWASMHFALGSAHFELQQWPEAIQAFKKAAELEPTDASSTYNVAVSYYNSRFYGDAEVWYRETLRRNPNAPERATILRVLGELARK